jgi:CRP-like cAMP-binding protein
MRKISITQREIGQIIGMSRESTNKQLREWAEKKWLKLERGGLVILDQRPLAEIVAAGGQDEE